MPALSPIKPTHKAVRAYYDPLHTFRNGHVDHEGAVRSAFQTLLAETARSHGWVLVPELSATAAGHLVRPDGTVRDQNSLPRGYWEAKDSDDISSLARTEKHNISFAPRIWREFDGETESIRKLHVL